MSLNSSSYAFQHDYCDEFFNFSRADMSKRRMVEEDFIRNFCLLLDKLHNSASTAIAESLFKRMSDPTLFYHTPIHILSALQFASVHNIGLAWWEELAIWFHDAIYVPSAKPGINECASSKFMEAMLVPFITKERLTWISLAIYRTQDHLLPEVPSTFNIIMDLDLCNFLFNSPGRETALRCVLMELERVKFNNRFPTRIELLQGRLDFLVHLIRKGPVYRSTTFLPFIPQATELIVERIGQMRADIGVLRGEN